MQLGLRGFWDFGCFLPRDYSPTTAQLVADMDSKIMAGVRADLAKPQEIDFG